MKRKQHIRYSGLAVVFGIATLALGCSDATSPTSKATAGIQSVANLGIQQHLSKIPARVVAKYDTDSVVNIGTPFDLLQHLHFVIENSSGDSVGTTPLRAITSISYVGSGDPGVCELPHIGAYSIYCPATDYNGYWAITVQGGRVIGLPNAVVRGTGRLYVLSLSNSPLSFVGIFDAQSTIREGRKYDVSKHFHFVVQNTSGDSVTYVPVVNISSIVWILQSGNAPAVSPSCTVATDVLTLNCPASSGTDFTGFYIVSVQQGSFNGIKNPAYRGSFNLYVSPRHRR